MAAHRMSGKAGTAPETGSGVIPGAIPEQRELRFVGVERLREAVLEVQHAMGRKDRKSVV